MASRGLGSLTLDLIARIGGFTEPLGKAERELDRKGRAMEARAKALQGAITGAFGTIAAGIGGFVAGIASVQLVFEGFKGAIDAADKFDELSARLDISTEKLSTWAYAAQLSGTSLDDLTAALPKLAKNMTEALDSSSKSAELFKALGISVVDSAGQLRAVQDVLPEIADRFKTLDDSTLEASLSMELFGKSGTGLLEFLNRGSEGIGELEQRARDLGIEIGGNTAGAAAEFKDELDNLRAVTQGLFTQLSAELLPELTQLVRWLVQLTKDGSTARDMADKLGTAFDVVAKGTSFLNQRLQSVGTVVEGLTGQFIAAGTAAEALINRDWSKLAAATKLAQDSRNMTTAGALGLVLAPGTQSPSGANQAPALPLFDSAPQSYLDELRFTQDVERAKKAREYQQRLMEALGGGDKPAKGAKAKKAGKSDAEREAEALAKAIQSANEQLDRQIALYGDTSEVARVRYEIENGELAKAAKAQQDDLLLKAQRLDLLKAEEEEMKRREAIERQQAERVADMLADIRLENELLGKTAEEKAVLNALRYAGVDAVSAEGRAIRDATLAFMEHEKQIRTQIDLMDDFRGGFSDAIADFVTGAKSMKDAIADFADDFARRITQLIAERWVEKLFGQFGSSNTGSSGNWIGTALGLLFGGGRANGGVVSPGMLYEVNERGPELLSVGGRDFLTMGASAGRITPNHMLGRGGGSTINQTFVVQGSPDRRTRQQMARESGRAASRAMTRTG